MQTPRYHTRYKAQRILSLLGFDPFTSFTEFDFIVDRINGGKTDNVERAYTICGYLDKYGFESEVLRILNEYESQQT